MRHAAPPDFFGATVRPRVVVTVIGLAIVAALALALASGSKSAVAELIPGLIGVLLVVAGYFLPAIVAQRRRHHNTAAILMLNLLLGWIIALIWAMTAPRRIA